MKQNTNTQAYNLIRINNKFQRVGYVAAKWAHDVDQQKQGRKLVTENGISIMVTWFSLS
jgi:hypothetical protein